MSGKKTGPEPERLKIEGDWQEAVKQSMKRGKPPAKKASKKKGRRRK